jgi:hypothetical protein
MGITSVQPNCRCHTDDVGRIHRPGDRIRYRATNPAVSARTFLGSGPGLRAKHLDDRLDEPSTTWEHVLSGGEKQRLGFARVLIQRPETIFMDEATAALDPPSQEQLMRLLLERLPDATVISVGHRPELEAYHTRKLVLEYRADGARLVADESLQRTFGRSALLLSKLPMRRRTRVSSTGSRPFVPKT